MKLYLFEPYRIENNIGTVTKDMLVSVFDQTDDFCRVVDLKGNTYCVLKSAIVECEIADNIDKELSHLLYKLASKYKDIWDAEQQHAKKMVVLEKEKFQLLEKIRKEKGE